MKKTTFILCVLLITATLLGGCVGGNDAGSTKPGKQPNGNETPETNVECASHNYENGICTVCKCSLWDGATDTSWHSILEKEFTITTAQQLAGFAQIVNGGIDFANATITLGADIDLNGLEWTPIGNDYYERFKGNFKGNGHTIYNLKITELADTADGHNYGFFGRNEGDISDLTIKNAVINLKNPPNYTIGILAANSDESKIYNCCVDGKIFVECDETETDTVYTIGGLVGSASDIEISDSSAICDVSVDCDGSPYTQVYAGVFAGVIRGKVSKSYSEGNLNLNFLAGMIDAGGFIGTIGQYAGIYNCYSKASVKAEASVRGSCSVAGFISECEANTEIFNCYAAGNVNALCSLQESKGSARAVGFVSSPHFSKTKIENCFSIGDTITNTTGLAYACSFSTCGTNCYYNSEQKSVCCSEFNSSATPAPLNDLKKIKFYTDILKWDSSIWQFKEGDLPTLK